MLKLKRRWTNILERTLRPESLMFSISKKKSCFSQPARPKRSDTKGPRWPGKCTVALRSRPNLSFPGKIAGFQECSFGARKNYPTSTSNISSFNPVLVNHHRSSKQKFATFPIVSPRWIIARCLAAWDVCASFPKNSEWRGLFVCRESPWQSDFDDFA